MNEAWIDTKADLLSAISAAWNRLHALLDALDAEAMVTHSDGSGWHVRDHVTHLAAWERSIVSLLQGQTRYDGLGVSEALYRSGDYDAINDDIMRRERHRSPAAAIADLRVVHEQLLALLAPLSDEDLLRPVGAYTDSEHGRRAEIAMMDIIVGNTAAHYEEHIGWMREWLP